MGFSFWWGKAQISFQFFDNLWNLTWDDSISFQAAIIIGVTLALVLQGSTGDSVDLEGETLVVNEEDLGKDDDIISNWNTGHTDEW